MTHEHIRTLLDSAQQSRTALLAFNVVLLETAEALTAGAEAAQRPVVLQISQNCVAYHGGLEPIGVAAISLARQADVPVSVHLDHAQDTSLIQQAVSLGFDSVMYDGSRLDDESNRASTAEVVKFCQDSGVAVEAELGEIGGKDGVHSPTARTDPQQAQQFVADTGVDSLAVAVGSSHAMDERAATLDLELVAHLEAAVPVPLVLHGSSGVPEAQLVGAVAAGMTKINISTHLNRLFTETVRAELLKSPTGVDPRKYVGAGRSVVADEAARLLTMF